MKFIAARLELLISLAFLWVVVGIFWPPISYFNKSLTRPLDAADPISTIVHALFAGFLVIVAIARREQMLSGVRSAWPIFVMVGLAYLSSFWSDVPELVLRRSTTLAVTTLFAVFLIVRFDWDRMIALLVKFNALAVVGSFAVAAVAHRLAIGGSIDYPTAWRGVFTAKNSLGGMCGFGITFAVYALRRGYGSRLIALAVIPANLALLYLSQSATPLILLLAATYVALTANAFRRRNAAGFAIGLALLLVGLLAFGLLAIEWAEVLTALGRSATLTGRTQIWRMSLENIAQRPWLGYGFGAFWRSGEIEARTMWQLLFWTVPHAHNLWLEVGLDLGIVGIAGAAMLWLTVLYRGIRVLTVPHAQHAVFCLALLIAILVENLTEYEFLKADSLYWVLFVAAYTYLGREVLATRAGTSWRRPVRSPIGVGVAAASAQR